MRRAATCTEAVDRLRRLALAAYTGQPVPKDVAEWLLDGVGRHFSGECDLGEALGLRGAGIRSPAHRAQRVRRDAELKAAFELADGGDTTASAWRRAEVLAHAVRRTARGRSLPADQGALEAAIARARSHGLELPESARRLLAICAGAPGV